MSTVLFLGVPSHGHINPTLGLVSELVAQGEEVIYFASDEFKEKILATGAEFHAYSADLNIFKMDTEEGDDPMLLALSQADTIVADILDQIKDIRFDYLIHSAAFPFTKVISPLLNIPTISSLAIFAGLKDFLEEMNQSHEAFPGMEAMFNAYEAAAQKLYATYGVSLPKNFLEMIYNTGDINLVYTSKYFTPDLDFFDDSFKFVGPPIYARKENMDFPFERLQNKKVIYISLGTIFSNYNHALYPIFFKSFADQEVVVVMAAYQVDLTGYDIPTNFIVRDYVPQSAILAYADVAITHAGMNSISDLIYSNTPFVAIPLGADQPALAEKAAALGATIVLDASKLTAEVLTAATEKVCNDPSYLQGIRKISDSFKAAGGYKKAVEEIFILKKEKGISN
ncbi:macrolide family glycosyltransferase [Chitinophaga sp.]|uniref:macrolide family glycosyltransferase n=1 Tax=Chitinophaga sp. TaxID=1869181 RepID=UPI002F91C8BE